MKKIILFLALLVGIEINAQIVGGYLPRTSIGSTYNVKLHGLKGDGSTDDRSALNTLLNTTAPAGSVIYFPPGTYNIGSAISVVDKQLYIIGDLATLHSTFNGTMLDISSTSTVTVLGSKWEFHDLNFTGTASGNAQIGINFSSYSGNFKVINCNFSSFGASGVGSAIQIGNTSISTALGGLVEGCRFTSNFLALYMASRSECIRINHNYFTLNNTPISIISGNNVITDNDICYNTNGIVGYSGTNNGHSIISNNNFLHNTNYTIRFEDTNLGNTFVGNHVYQGFVRFKNCTGMNIADGIMDVDNYEYDNNIGCTFNNVTFDSAYVNTTTLTSGPLPVYNDCKKLNGSLALSPNTFSQSTRKAVANVGDVYFTIQLSAGTTNMADATPYYFGSIIDRPLNTVKYNRTTLPYACTLIGYDLQVYTNSTPGSSESLTLSVVANNSSTITLNTAVSYTNNNSPTATTGMFNVSGTGLSTNFSAGDYVFAQLNTPTWATNPLSVSHVLTLYYKRQ